VSCRWVRGKLARAMDGNLDGGSRRRLEAHVAECAACREEMRELQRMDEVLADEPTVAPPEGMAATIVRKAEAHSMMRRRVMIPAWLEGLGLVGGLGAGAAVGFVGVVVLQATAHIDLAVSGAAAVVATAAAAGLGAFGSAYYRP